MHNVLTGNRWQFMNMNCSLFILFYFLNIIVECNVSDYIRDELCKVLCEKRKMTEKWNFMKYSTFSIYKMIMICQMKNKTFYSMTWHHIIIKLLTELFCGLAYHGDDTIVYACRCGIHFIFLMKLEVCMGDILHSGSGT